MMGFPQIKINGKSTDSIHEHLIERDGLHTYYISLFHLNYSYDLLKTVKMHESCKYFTVVSMPRADVGSRTLRWNTLGPV